MLFRSAGPIVGGLIFGFLPVAVRSVAGPQAQWILYGALMIVIVFLLPQGITPAVERLMTARLLRRENSGENSDLGALPDARRAEGRG